MESIPQISGRLVSSKHHLPKGHDPKGSILDPLLDTSEQVGLWRQDPLSSKELQTSKPKPLTVLSSYYKVYQTTMDGMRYWVSTTTSLHLHGVCLQMGDNYLSSIQYSIPLIHSVHVYVDGMWTYLVSEDLLEVWSLIPRYHLISSNSPPLQKRA